MAVNPRLMHIIIDNADKITYDSVQIHEVTNLLSAICTGENMEKTWVKRLIGLALVIIAVALIPFLNEKGELERPVTVTVLFDRGLEVSDDGEGAVIKAAKESLARPDASILISGHTGTRGDGDANRALAESRAESIKDRLAAEGVDEERIETIGLGGAEPLEQEEGESDRAFQRRLARTEILINP